MAGKDDQYLVGQINDFLSENNDQVVNEKEEMDDINDLSESKVDGFVKNKR